MRERILVKNQGFSYKGMICYSIPYTVEEENSYSRTSMEDQKHLLKKGLRVTVITIGLMIALLGEYSGLRAQEAATVHPDSVSYQNSILYLPVFGSTPETGLMLGGLVMPRFKIAGAGPETRSSAIFFSGIYTLNQQVMASFAADLILPDEEWVINTQIYGTYFPDRFWGVGASTAGEDEVQLLFTELNLGQAVLKKVKPHFFTGPVIRLNSVRDITFRSLDGEKLHSPQLRGAGGSRTIGVGFILRHDRRNSNITPTEHHFAELMLMANPGIIGTDHEYFSLLADSRKYIDLGTDGSSVLALQGLARLTEGNPAFTELSTMGGESISRGYYSGRFRAQNSAQVQMEWRQHVYGRFGFTLFGAAGDVWNRFEELTANRVKFSAGMGVRLNVNKQETTHLRADFGVGENTTGFYLSFGEAF
jgi:hypothetical protein